MAFEYRIIWNFFFKPVAQLGLAASNCQKMKVVFHRMYLLATSVLECFFLVLLEKHIAMTFSCLCLWRKKTYWKHLFSWIRVDYGWIAKEKRQNSCKISTYNKTKYYHNKLCYQVSSILSSILSQMIVSGRYYGLLSCEWDLTTKFWAKQGGNTGIKENQHLFGGFLIIKWKSS